MKFIKRIVCNPYVFVFLLFVAVFEGVLLYRHGFFKNALIERGFITQKKEERSDYHCLLAWENTLKKMNYKADICFIGNSITFGSDFQSEYPKLKIINLGYSGDRMEGVAIRSGQIAAVNPVKIFIMIGINDLAQNYITIERFSVLYEEMLNSIQKSNPEAKLYLESILPVNHKMRAGLTTKERIIEANDKIKKIALKRGLVYVDLYSLYIDENNNLQERFTPDGLHLYPSAYMIWSNALREYLID